MKILILIITQIVILSRKNSFNNICFKSLKLIAFSSLNYFNINATRNPTVYQFYNRTQCRYILFKITLYYLSRNFRKVKQQIFLFNEAESMLAQIYINRKCIYEIPPSSLLIITRVKLYFIDNVKY